MSNSDVYGRFAIAFLLLLFGQNSKRRTDSTIVARAKQAIISSFDPVLPNLTLESFLKYETGDTLIDWRQSKCGRPGDDQEFYRARCVTAYSSLPDNRVITVTVHIPIDVSEPPALISVTVIDKGLERSIRLIEIPAVIQGHKIPGRPERWPRDLFPLSRIG